MNENNNVDSSRNSCSIKAVLYGNYLKPIQTDLRRLLDYFYFKDAKSMIILNLEHENSNVFFQLYEEKLSGL